MRSRRLLFSLLIGTIAGALHLLASPGADFTWPYRGAHLLVGGQNPYTDPQLAYGNPYPYDAPLYYPLLSLLLVTPLIALPLPVAAALFVGLSVALLAYALLSKRPQLWPLLMSAPLVVAVYAGQWAPLLVALALLPSLLPLALVKPNLGIAALVYNGSWRSWAAAVTVFACSWLVAPSWVSDWLANMQTGNHTSPVVLLPVLALGLLGLRTKEGRLFCALMVLPQKLRFYDQLLVFLIARTTREALTLSVASWCLFLASAWGVDHRLCAVGLYLPALVMVLRRSPGSTETETTAGTSRPGTSRLPR